MSWIPGAEHDLDKLDAVETIIIPRTGDLGNFEVRRALPSRRKRMVGPFIFWDEMGPGEFLTGSGLDVRPHPHIGLSTVTYLYHGSLHHRDSLGTDQEITPGALNLMSAGRGIVHSERTSLAARRMPSSLFGIQSWLAQPKHLEDSTPTFVHASASELPVVQGEGKTLKVILGQAFGAKSPVETDWDTLYLDVLMEEGATFPVPVEAEERALYPLNGSIEVAGEAFTPHQMIVLRPGREVTVKALKPTRLAVLGGQAMDGPRYIWWNFVASSQERIEAAKEDWRQGRFEKVPGDEQEFIPLPRS